MTSRLQKTLNQDTAHQHVPRPTVNPRLIQQHHVRVPGFISARRASSLAEAFRQLDLAGGCVRDQQAPRSPAAYNFLPFVRLLVEKNQTVSQLCGEALLPTYAYGRIYRHGETLPRHRDRDACEISISLNLAQDSPWPLYLETPQDRIARLELEPGDAVMYLGCEADHWREFHTGEFHIQVFLHYVLAEGRRAFAFFDRKAPRLPELAL